MNDALTHREAMRVATALGLVLAGEGEATWPDDTQVLCQTAQSKLNAVPRGGVMLAFSKKELELLWQALGGTPGESGMTPPERRTFAAAANRVADAAGFTGPRF
jgi:hypothetical protein